MGWFRHDRPAPAAWPPSRDPDQLRAVLEYNAYRDPIGHALHLLAAMIFLFSLPFSTSGSAGAFAGLMIVAIVRLPWGWHSALPLLRQPLLIGLIAWTAWAALSLTWSMNVPQGLDELGAMRMLALPLVLWSMLPHARWLVLAALLGVFAQNLVQFGQFVGWIPIDNENALRFPGMIHPIQTGAWCAASMLFCICGLLHGRGHWRTVCGVLLVAATFGLIVAGSRGPWIAVVLTIPLFTLIEAWRRPRTRLAVLAILLIGVTGSVGAYMVPDGVVRKRVDNAWRDFSSVLQENEYWTSTGLRVGQWKWSLQLTAQKPIQGLGAGSFNVALQDHPDYLDAVDRATDSAYVDVPGYDPEADDPAANVEDRRALRRAATRAERLLDFLDRDHNHSTFLYVLAMLGIVGLGIVLITCAGTMVGLVRYGGQAPFRRAAPWVFACWIISAQFDCYQLNGHLLGLFAFLVTLALHVPRATGDGQATDGDGAVGSANDA